MGFYAPITIARRASIWKQKRSKLGQSPLICLHRRHSSHASRGSPRQLCQRSRAPIRATACRTQFRLHRRSLHHRAPQLSRQPAAAIERHRRGHLREFCAYSGEISGFQRAFIRLTIRHRPMADATDATTAVILGSNEAWTLGRQKFCFGTGRAKRVSEHSASKINTAMNKETPAPVFAPTETMASCMLQEPGPRSRDHANAAS